jgi:putative ABC transport system substrate-binding protein
VPVIEGLKDHADALYVCADALINANGVRIVTTALARRLPTLGYTREFAEAGGLLSYGPSYSALFRRAGDYVDKILRGAKPSDLSVEQPTQFDLVINLKTAKGLTIPGTVLARADDLIE